MKKFILFAIVTIVAISCKKEDEKVGIRDMNGTKWQIHYSAAGSGDYIITFKSNGDFAYDEDGVTDPAGTFVQKSDSIRWDFRTYDFGTYVYYGKLVNNDSMIGIIKQEDVTSVGTFTAGIR